MLILGIESSCDETAAAVVEMSEDIRRIRSSVVASQVDVHALYGGVVPEIASRAHIEAITGVVESALREANVTMEEIDAILIAMGNTLIKLEENNGELSEEDLEQVAGGWTWGGFFKGLVMGVVVTAVIVGLAAAAIATSVATGGAAAPLAVATTGQIVSAVIAGAATVAAGGAIGGVAGGIVEL
jgi:hypothetical protein